MNGYIEKLTGMAPLTDQVIGTDLLMASKTAVRNYSFAITETANQEIRQTLMDQLEDAIDAHWKISKYMIEKGYYHPKDTKKQLEVDLRTAKTAMSIANNLKIPEEISSSGIFKYKLLLDNHIIKVTNSVYYFSVSYILTL